MADEIRRIITVDVSGAVDSLEEMEEATESAGYSFKSLGDAKKYIDKLRASLIDLDEDSEEYANTVAEIDVVQDKLNKAIKATGSTIKNAEGSYNALSKQMSELKKRFKETNDEAERTAIAKQIVTINDKLKDMDASIGNYQRNVGNYEAAFTGGLKDITAKIEALGNPLVIAKNGVNALGKALKSLIANPVGAVIMAIVAALSALKKGFEGSEEASNKLKRAFAAFEPILNTIKNLFTSFANVVGNIAEKVIPAFVNSIQSAEMWMMKLLNKIGVVSDEKLKAFEETIEKQKESVKLSQELADREIKLEERKRKLLVDTAKKELEISELRAKASDKDKYSAAERKKFLEQAIQTERELNAEKLAVAQEEYDIALERSKQTDNDAATNRKLAEAEANLYNVRKEYFDKERKLISQVSAARGEATKETEELKKKEMEAIQQIQGRIELSLMDESAREVKIIDDKYKEELALFEKYHIDTTKLTEEYNKQLEALRKEDLDKIKEINNRASLSLMERSDRDLKVIEDQYQEELKLFEKYEQDTVKLTEEYNRKIAEAKAGDGEDKLKKIEEEATLQQFIADKTIQIEFEKKERLLEIDRQRLEDEKVIYEELLSLDNLSEEKRQEYADKLAEINAGIVDNSNQTKELQKQHIQELVDAYSKMANGIGDILNTVAGYMQDNVKERVKAGKMTEEEGKKEFEKTKKLQIAAAIINGLAGIATAISTAMSLGPILGPIMGAINATAIAVSTGVQIAKIKSTTLDGGSGSSSVSASAATPSSSATAYVPNYSTNVTGESENVDLANAISEKQGDTRVYVVESDIAQAGKKAEVRESESTF